MTRMARCGHLSPLGPIWICGCPNLIIVVGIAPLTLGVFGYDGNRLYVLFTPEIHPDGTRVFVAPIGDKGSIPLIALDDLGWWARYIFDNAPSTTGRDFAIASQVATFPDIVEAFTRVTGLPARYDSVSLDEYFTLWNGKEVPIASAVPQGKSWESNFRSWWSMWRDNIVKRDMDEIKSIHPPITLEKWMRDNRYDGTVPSALLKNAEDRRGDLKRLIGDQFYYVGF